MLRGIGGGARFSIDSNGTAIGLISPSGSIFYLSNTYTWAQLQALANQTAGTRAYVSDLGNAEFIYDGARWTRKDPLVLSQSGIPIIMQSSGSIGNNGALTGLTALGVTYSGGCYMYFPVNTIATGVAAGWYYVVMSSTTAGTIYNNLMSSTQPTIPASPVAFATTGPGAYTQQTAVPITAIAAVVPANFLGVNGGIQFDTTWNQNGTAGAKYEGVGFGSNDSSHNQNSLAHNLTGGSTVDHSQQTIRNRGATNSQVVFSNFSASSFGGNGNSPNAFATIDTTASQFALLSLQIAVVTDWIVMDSYHIIGMPS